MYKGLLKMLWSDYQDLDKEIKQNLSFDTYVRFVIEANKKR